MGPSPAVNHRRAGVVTHAGGAQQMPTGVATQLGEQHLLCAGGFHHFLSARYRMVQHAFSIFADLVLNLGRRYAVGVGEHRVQRHPVMLFRQVLSHQSHAHNVTKPLREFPVVVPTPGHRLAQQAAESRSQRGQFVAQHLHVVAPQEIAIGVGLVEFLAEHAAAARASQLLKGLIKNTHDDAAGVVHQVFANQPGTVGQTIGE